MKIIEPSFEILHMPSGEEILRVLELAGRTCYQSDPAKATQFIRGIIKKGHESVIEHMSATVRLICDRGVTHELVRHRLSSFSQESTRYANYSKVKFGNEITVIRPFFWDYGSGPYNEWRQHMKECEKVYLWMLETGSTAQEARSVLPNSLKTDIVVTANMREWRHIFKLRCGKAAHPQMRQSMLPVLNEFHTRVPVLFDELYDVHESDIQKFI
jgi:thymidylate synthase (FAD)